MEVVLLDNDSKIQGKKGIITKNEKEIMNKKNYIQTKQNIPYLLIIIFINDIEHSSKRDPWTDIPTFARTISIIELTDLWLLLTGTDWWQTWQGKQYEEFYLPMIIVLLHGYLGKGIFRSLQNCRQATAHASFHYGFYGFFFWQFQFKHWTLNAFKNTLYCNEYIHCSTMYF